MMYSQSLILSLFTILASFGLCFGSYLEERHYLTNHQPYNERLVKAKHEQFSFMARAHHPSIEPSPQSHNTVNVNDYGAKSNDGQVDNEVI